MKNIKIDISVYIIILLSLLCANFKSIIIFYLIIIFHEFGHIFIIKLFKKKIISIKLYVFGGITKYNTLLNHSILKELLISIFGIVNQLILFIVFYILYKYSLINAYTYKLFIDNNISLIIFNLLPIIGLDGEKIIHLLLEYFFSYKLSNYLSLVISFISLIVFILISVNLKINIMYVIIFLIYKHIKYFKSIKYLENKFLLERYLYDIPYKKIKYICTINLNKIKQETYFFFNNIREYDILKNKFK